MPQPLAGTHAEYDNRFSGVIGDFGLLAFVGLKHGLWVVALDDGCSQGRLNSHCITILCSALSKRPVQYLMELR